MILYTIYEPSVIFKNIDYFNNEKINSDFTEMEVNGVKVLAAKTGNNEMRIERILSTNPLHYLNPGLQPGMVISK